MCGRVGTQTRLVSVMCAFRILLVCLQAALSFGYPNGAPPLACKNLLPIHPNTAPQRSISPYKIATSSKTYSPNTPLTVTLYYENGNGNGRYFMAFLLQARAHSNTQPVGRFQLSAPQTRLLSCSGNNDSITHSAPVARSKLQLTWIPPATDVGNIVFLGTAAEKIDVYWGVLRSAPISAAQIQTTVGTVGTTASNGGASGGSTTGGGTGGQTGSSTRLSTHVTAILGVYLYAVYAFSARW